MNVKKKNALFGRYPSCDLLNNALLKEQINIYDDLIRSYKVDLWDIENNNLPEEGIFRDEWIRVKLVGSDCKNLEEYQIYALNQIKIYTEKLKQCYDQLARFSQWKPSE